MSSFNHHKKKKKIIITIIIIITRKQVLTSFTAVHILVADLSKCLSECRTKPKHNNNEGTLPETAITEAQGPSASSESSQPVITLRR